MISTNLRQVIGEIDKYKLDVKANVKATRDEMAASALMLMKKQVSTRQGYTGRGAKKKYIPTAAGAPPAKQTGTLFRTIKARKWNKVESYGANVGLMTRSKAYYGVILEAGSKTGKWRHQWAEPAFRQFQPIANSIIAKNLGRVK